MCRRSGSTVNKVLRWILGFASIGTLVVWAVFSYFNYRLTRIGGSYQVPSDDLVVEIGPTLSPHYIICVSS